MSQGQPRDPRKEQFWRDHLQRWQQSGLTIRAYCRRHHLSEPSFYGWRRTLAQRDHDRPTPREPAPLFLPVHLEPEPVASPASLELVLPNGRLLRIPAAFPADRLRALLTLLEEKPC